MWRLLVQILYTLLSTKINGYFEEINGNIYLTIAPTIKIKEIIKKYEVLWSKIKELIRLKTNNWDNYDEKKNDNQI